MHRRIYAIGHSNLPVADFLDLLQRNSIELLVDVRSIPLSKTFPHFNGTTLKRYLAKHQIAYTHIHELGGRRPKQREIDPSPNTHWESTSFRNYADYALGDQFSDGLTQLMDISRKATTAIMCAEAVWWRCHRQIIADHLIARNIPVYHIIGTNEPKKAVMNEHAVVTQRENGDRTVIYPADQFDLGL